VNPFRRSCRTYLLVAVCCLAAAQAHGQDEAEERLTLSLERYMSVETGAHLVGGVTWSLSEVEAWAFRFEDRPPAPAAATIRIARTLVLDIPIAVWLAVFQHEAFGHGGRAREVGSSAGFHMGSPWERRSSYASFDAEGLSLDDRILIYAGGSEANGWAATLMERNFVGGRPPRSFELWYFIYSRFTTSQYVLLTTPDPVDDPLGFWSEFNGGGDVANYLGLLNEKYYGTPGITPEGSSPTVIAGFRLLERQARWNALDPGMWIALWTVARRAIQGEERAPIWLPRIAGRPFLPLLTADWSPVGGLISLETVVGRAPDSPTGSRWFSFTIRRGDGPAGEFGALGAATDVVFRGGLFRIGGEAEIWGGADQGVGGGVRARFTVNRGPLKNAFFNVGAKTPGHWPGRPVGPGLFGRVGYVFVH